MELLNGHIPQRNIPLIAGITKTDGLFLVARKIYWLLNFCWRKIATFLFVAQYDRLMKELLIENNGTVNTFDLMSAAAEAFGN